MDSAVWVCFQVRFFSQIKRRKMTQARNANNFVSQMTYKSYFMTGWLLF